MNLFYFSWWVAKEGDGFDETDHMQRLKAMQVAMPKEDSEEYLKIAKEYEEAKEKKFTLRLFAKKDSGRW